MVKLKQEEIIIKEKCIICEDELDNETYDNYCRECFWKKYPTGKFPKPKGVPRTRWKNMKKQERNKIAYEKTIDPKE